MTSITSSTTSSTTTTVLVTTMILLQNIMIPLASGFVTPSVPTSRMMTVGSSSSSAAPSFFGLAAQQQQQQRRRTPTSLCMWEDKEDDEEDDDLFDLDLLYEPEMEELDRAREMFEALLQKENPYSASNPTVFNAAFQDEQTSSSTSDDFSSSSSSNSFANIKRSILSGKTEGKADDVSNLLDRLLSKTERLIHDANQKLADCIDAEKLLTPEGRVYRENEMRMIKYITDNDAAEEALRHYWTTEYEISHHERMALVTDDSVMMDEQTKQQTLEKLVEMFPSWAEPYYVLGSLYSTRNHYELAEHYLTQAIQLKPWHFMAIAKLTATYFEMGNSKDGKHWYERQLPRVSDPERRTEWIITAFRSAKEQLNNAESFTDDYYNKKNHEQQKLVEARIVQQHQFEKQQQALNMRDIQEGKELHWTKNPSFTLGSSSVTTSASTVPASSVMTSSSSTSVSSKLPTFPTEQSFFEPNFSEEEESWQ